MGISKINSLEFVRNFQLAKLINELPQNPNLAIQNGGHRQVRGFYNFIFLRELTN